VYNFLNYQNVRTLHRRGTGKRRVCAKEKLQEALYSEVIEVARAEARGQEDGLGENVSGVPDGAKILFRKDAGTKVPWDDALRILDTKEVLATIEEIPEEEIA
jgi:hypothetical protein